MPRFWHEQFFYFVQWESKEEEPDWEKNTHVRLLNGNWICWSEGWQSGVGENYKWAGHGLSAGVRLWERFRGVQNGCRLTPCLANVGHWTRMETWCWKARARSKEYLGTKGRFHEKSNDLRK